MYFGFGEEKLQQKKLNLTVIIDRLLVLVFRSDIFFVTYTLPVLTALFDKMFSKCENFRRRALLLICLTLEINAT